MLRFLDDIREALGIDRKHTPPAGYKPPEPITPEGEAFMDHLFKMKGWKRYTHEELEAARKAHESL